MICWVIAAALAAIAGTLYGLDKTYKPFIFLQILLPIFAATILGGIGQRSARSLAHSLLPSPR